MKRESTWLCEYQNKGGGNLDLSAFFAYLTVDAMLSDEAERIRNPKRNEKKYANLVQCCKLIGEFAKETGSQISSDDIDFPKDNHVILIYLPTEDDDIDITKCKGKLAQVIDKADGVVVDTMTDGRIRFCFVFYNTYAPKGEGD